MWLSVYLEFYYGNASDTSPASSCNMGCRPQPHPRHLTPYAAPWNKGTGLVFIQVLSRNAWP